MEFFIRENSLEPILKMQLVQDGRNDFDTFYEKLSNSSIKFSMRDENTGVYKILNQPGGIVQKVKTSENSPTEYYIFYSNKILYIRENIYIYRIYSSLTSRH